ncbi:UDP-N-acetylmuramoyl-L-alanine--D-glutamate ligase [Candidatus Daviesbacteria bacterium]|nr:UDP-N-acetylmuramoyl-L-alanine--D-glutamate ligase [Candidatus Daviesbacteria bacterium]
MDFNKLRQKHQQLVFEGYKIEQENGYLHVTFDFLLTPDIRFKPQVIFPNVKNPGNIDNLVFNLGMVELLSYWKAACPKQIIIKAGDLDEDQIKFWKKLLIKGLGEFFYTNKIDFTKEDLVEFVRQPSRLQAKFDGELKDRDLVMVGGGKDSAVTLESISKGKEYSCLLLNPTEAAIKMAEAGGCKNSIIIKRIIDPKLLELNAQGYLNGHTPFSAYLAFLSVLTGVLYDYKNLVVSNEASSNEGNVTWMGQEINHQYSKTSEFEKDFRDYSSKYLASSANYFSYLRSFGELQISEMFSKMEKYHKIFRSCNRGSKQGIWCGKCPKCVSTYILLYPFLGKKTDEIFGKNLLEDKSLEPIIKGLLRENDVVKPFECVATVEEIKTALSLINQKVLILGFGREGKATLNYYKKHFPNTEIGITDKSDGENYLDKLKDYDVIIKSPGIPYLPEIRKAQNEGKTITSATQIFFDNFKGQIIGVTGTKGKSTTSSLIYEVLKTGGIDAHVIGNIGKPALDLLDELNENSVVVYELSSFQLEGLTKSPHIAVMTNFYPEHLDHHGNLSAYFAAKSNITKYQTEQDYLICNKDVAIENRAMKIPFTQNGLDDSSPAKIIGKLFDIPQEEIDQAIKNFKPLPHRLEFVGEFRGIKFYNDSLATIPQATIGALQALGENVETLIAGGFDRGIDYSILGEAIAKSNIKNLILFPDTGEKIKQACIKYQVSSIKYFNVNNMKDAVELAFEHTSPGKIVLLSPASSSFNLFKDYADRGNQFKKYVTSL